MSPYRGSHPRRGNVPRILDAANILRELTQRSKVGRFPWKKRISHTNRPQACNSQCCNDAHIPNMAADHTGASLRPAALCAPVTWPADPCPTVMVGDSLEVSCQEHEMRRAGRRAFLAADSLFSAARGGILAGNLSILPVLINISLGLPNIYQDEIIISQAEKHRKAGN